MSSTSRQRQTHMTSTIAAMIGRTLTLKEAFGPGSRNSDLLFEDSEGVIYHFHHANGTAAARILAMKGTLSALVGAPLIQAEAVEQENNVRHMCHGRAVNRIKTRYTFATAQVRVVVWVLGYAHMLFRCSVCSEKVQRDAAHKCDGATLCLYM